MYCVLETANAVLICMCRFMAVQLAVVYNLVIRVMAGFCADPVGILIEAVGNNTDNDQRSQYYVSSTCDAACDSCVPRTP